MIGYGHPAPKGQFPPRKPETIPSTGPRRRTGRIALTGAPFGCRGLLVVAAIVATLVAHFAFHLF